jgi:hypothetical protein
MQLTDNIGDSVQCSLTWLEPARVRLTFVQCRTLESLRSWAIEMQPGDLAGLADYIQDFLCR